MKRIGHYGAALLGYAPIGLLLVASGREPLALLGGVIVIGGSMVPDWDCRIPFMSHRGITHTVWFGLAVGGVLGLGGWAIGGRVGFGTSIELAVFGFVIGLVMILSHIAADALTPMGIRPVAPLGSGTVSFGLTRAGNPIANGLLLLVGLLAAGSAFVIGQGVSITLL